MGIEIIDTIKQKNGGKFPIVSTNDVQGGFHQVDTIAERDSIPQERRKEGMYCYVKEDPSNKHLYQLIDGEWANFNYGYHVGPTPPEDTSLIWINTADEDVDLTLSDDAILAEIRQAIKDNSDKVDSIHYAFTQKLDSGTFKDETTEEGGGEETPSTKGIPEPELPKPPKTIHHICHKRGNKADLPQLLDGEFGICVDVDELWYGYNGKLRRIAGGGSGGAVGTQEYIDLISPNGTKFRVRVTDAGELQIYDAKIDDAEDPDVSEVGRFKGLVINQIYGGGLRDCGDTPISHGFIELYNNTQNDINLKGLSIQYGENGGAWTAFPLRGLVPAFSSFLIRCAQHTPVTNNAVRCKILNYDMSWDIPLTDKGMKVCLKIGTDAIVAANPFKPNGQAEPIPGYIDMIGAGGDDITKTIDGFENRYGQYLSKTKSCHRKDFADKDNNFTDCESIDYMTCDVSVYGPRYSKSGVWDIYYNKLALSTTKPNLININYGVDGNTTRSWSWQSTLTEVGYLRYRERGTSDWTVVESTKRPVQHEHQDGIIHNVTVYNLTPGKHYEYQCGEDGKWSDIYPFEVEDFGTTNLKTPVKMLWTTDQQGWNEWEYSAWRDAFEYIDANEEYNFMLNTGDISQNGGRLFEWLYYYEFAKAGLCTHPHQITCGNNDLIAPEKVDPTAFTYYQCLEGAPADLPSCYDFTIGNIHFISLHSWGYMLSGNIEKQTAWLKRIFNERKNHWNIIIMHVSPYTCVQMAKHQHWIPVFEELKPDAVFCGHNHCYSRSKPILGGQENALEGIYYLMCQATGYKLSGKEGPQEPPKWWYGHCETPGQPTYMMVEFTDEQIDVKSYRVDGIMPLETDNGPLNKVLFDSVTIPHRSRRS